MNITTFVNWSKEQGVQTTAVVQETPYAGYGLFSTENIDSSAIVVHIPNDMLLTSSKALQVDLEFSRAAYTYLSKKYNTTENLELLVQEVHNERLVLCLFLIYCKFFKTDSVWKPYMDVLPSLESCKQNYLLFNPEYVKGTNLQVMVQLKRASLLRDLKVAMDATAVDQEKDDDTWLGKIQFEMVLWADTVFWSRVVGVGGDQGSSLSSDMSLIPFFDFANHSDDNPNIRWQLNQSGIDLITYPERMIPKGKELLLSYGSKPNQELLFLHGFCIEDNPQNSRLTLPLMPFLNPDEAPDNLFKIQWLKQIGVKPSLTLTKEEDDDNELIRCGWTVDSIATMYVVAMDEDNHLVLEKEKDQIALYLSGQRMENLQDVAVFVKQAHQYPIIKLKVAMLLIEALEHHYTIISDEHEDVQKSFLWKQVQIYRREETNTIKCALDRLIGIRDDLMTHPTVMHFLNEE